MSLRSFWSPWAPVSGSSRPTLFLPGELPPLTRPLPPLPPLLPLPHPLLGKGCRLRQSGGPQCMAGAASAARATLAAWGLVSLSRRSPKLGALRAQREPTAYFESLKIQTTGDVVRHMVRATSLSADLVRGPGGVGEISQAACRAVDEAICVCKSFLPKVLRDQRSVSRILSLLSDALSLAGQPSSRDAFAALESPLVSFHNAAPLAMRKALQTRFAGMAEPRRHSRMH